MKHWIFDLDGTLVDSYPPYFSALERISKKYKVSLRDTEIKRSRGMAAKDFLKSIIPTEYVETEYSWLCERSIADTKYIVPFAGIENILEFLQAQKIQMAIWTGREMETASLIIKNTGLEKYFPVCVSGTCVAKNKPHTDGLLKIASQFSCNPSAITVIGNHEHDMTAAKTENALAIRASWHSPNFEACELSDFQFTKIDHFHEWLIKKLG